MKYSYTIREGDKMSKTQQIEEEETGYAENDAQAIDELVSFEAWNA